MFDTHCHLNFKAFDGHVDRVIEDAKKIGVTHIVIPGTDSETSKKAVEIADRFENVYAAVGIHPHHVYENVKSEIQEVERFLSHQKVVAIGEVGVDRHYYQRTKYEKYTVDENFITLQKEILKKCIDTSINRNKSLIIHNREAKEDLFEVLNEKWDRKLEGRTVFHCCEPDTELLKFAMENKIFIGVDGDVTYRKDKLEFIKKVPLSMLVLETDSPFLLPEPLKSEKKYPNEPKNLKLIAEFIAQLTNVSIDRLIDTSTENAMKLFRIS